MLLCRSALHLAAYAGHCDCVWLLLQNGAKMDMQDLLMGVTALHCAASMGHIGCLKLLIKHGAHVNSGIEKKSPLHYAVQNLAVGCVKELLENNAIPNTPQVSYSFDDPVFLWASANMVTPKPEAL